MEKIFISFSAVIVVSAFIVLWGRLTCISSLFNRMDHFFNHRIQPLKNPRHLSTFMDITSLGSATLVGMGTFISSMAFLLQQHYVQALVIALSACSGTLGRIIKRGVSRSRPEQSEGFIFGSSFPSNHTLMSSSFYPLLGNLSYPSHTSGLSLFLFMISVSLPAFIGISRMVLRAHFFSDVLAGWILGGTIVWACLQCSHG